MYFYDAYFEIFANAFIINSKMKTKIRIVCTFLSSHKASAASLIDIFIKLTSFWKKKTRNVLIHLKSL